MYHYLPVKTANDIVNQRLINALKDLDIRPVVVTRDMDSEIKDVYQFKALKQKDLIFFARFFIHELNLLPEIDRFLWVNPIRNQVTKILQSSNFDFIHTNSIPHSTHLLGAYLKRKSGLPWVAHFYEAWIDNFYRSYDKMFFKQINRKMEKKVAEHADLIIHTNDIIVDRWIKRYGDIVSGKIEVLPLCTDDTIEPNEYVDSSGKCTIVHTGNIYGKRNLNELIKALNLLKEKYKNLKDRLEIKFIGITVRDSRLAVERNNLRTVVEFEERMVYEKVKLIINKANALLLIDSLDPDENVFALTKLPEYFSHQKPIIGITSKYSDSRKYLTESGHFVVGKNQHRKLCKYIESLMLGHVKNTFDKEYYKRFLPSEIARLYKSYLQKHQII